MHETPANFADIVSWDVRFDRGEVICTDPLSFPVLPLSSGIVALVRREILCGIAPLSSGFWSAPAESVASCSWPPSIYEGAPPRHDEDPKEGKIMSGNFDQAKGKVKQAVGDLTGDKDLKREGKTDENAGKVKEFVEDTEDKVEDALDKVKDKLTKH
jgi:uncharacterized protein YjbJ (UPF0337 family)